MFVFNSVCIFFVLLESEVKKMPPKVLRSVYLDLYQIEKIKQLSETTRVPQAEYIREAIDILLQKYKKKLG